MGSASTADRPQSRLATPYVEGLGFDSHQAVRKEPLGDPMGGL